MTQDRQSERESETPPGVLTAEDLRPADLRQVDETVGVVPLDGSDGDSSGDHGRGLTADRRATRVNRPDATAFVAAGQIQTPEGGSSFAARSDHVGRCFEECLLAVLDAFAPGEEPATALAVLLEDSSIPVTVEPSDTD